MPAVTNREPDLITYRYNPDEPRNVHGEWTTGGDDGRIQVADAGRSDSDVKHEFVAKYIEQAQRGAKELEVPVENILGLSAIESQWGNGRIAKKGNNYFSLHAPAAFQIGTFPALDDETVLLPIFPSYAASMKSFFACCGHLIRRVQDPIEFAKKLQDAGKYGIDHKRVRDPITHRMKSIDTPKPNFVHETATTIRLLRPYIDDELKICRR